MLVILSGLPGTGKTTLARAVELRLADIPGHRVPTWAEVLAHDYRAWDSKRLVIDTAGVSAAESMQAIVSALSV